MASDTLPPTEALEVENGLSLVPRLKLLLTINPTDTASSTKLIDEWKLSQTLIEFLNTSFSVPITVPEEDVRIKRCKDVKKRKREDPVAQGTIFIRDLGFVKSSLKKYESVDEKDNESVVLERKLKEWRKLLVEKMNGVELNLEGSKYKLSVSMPESDDFDEMKKEWEEMQAFGDRGYSRGSVGGRQQQPDTIVMRGVPSRWFAEPRVSSKPSMLVTHTIFSFFGKIRNLNIAEDDDLGKDGGGENEDVVKGLNCKIVVRFESYKDFCNALKALSGRSLQKQGSRLKADYEVTWDKSNSQERSVRNYAEVGGRYGNEVSRHRPYVSQYTPENGRTKRFRE
uniref:A-kinase anchor protein 17A n=1 Tax=Kalanchoe fedtschenkoi TaxID=63787 RepID=A0A7N0UVP9_KALFE